MKKTFILSVSISMSIFFLSCKKENAELSTSNVTENTGSPTTAGRTGADSVVIVPTVVTLYAGQSMVAGNITITNDEAFMYISYNLENGYTLKQTHLYVGSCDLIPVNNPGNPMPGQFPYKATHANVTSYTYQVPLVAIGGVGTCGCIAAHAVVSKAGEGDNTAWGAGIRINLTGGNWGTKSSYCIQ